MAICKILHTNRCKVYEGVGSSLIVNAGVASQPGINDAVADEIENMESQQGYATEQEGNEEGIETNVSGKEKTGEVGQDGREDTRSDHESQGHMKTISYMSAEKLLEKQHKNRL